MNRTWFPTLFDDFFDNNEWMPRINATAPAVNVKESPKEYTMDIAAPGIKKEFCRVNIDHDGNLVVAIENKLEHKEEDKKERYLRREFSYSNYQQAYTLPDNVDKENIAAKVENGVLTISIPKLAPKEEAKTQRMIEIK
ncbi:MAG: Hsp20 family protein [Bacteroidales bacterium]|nr:Hsp20 family protein [Bacteroidales bacterium]MDY5036630.1 Hsp20 family protein [Prevotella sp.]